VLKEKKIFVAQNNYAVTKQNVVIVSGVEKFGNSNLSLCLQNIVFNF